MKQITETEIREWDEMTGDEKLDRLTAVLTRAGSDLQFRKRCLYSADSAVEAVSEEGGVQFPDDFRIEFVTPKERMKTLILAMPEYIAPENGEAEQRQAEDFQLCTYLLWRS
jgi:hypothetical protein